MNYDTIAPFYDRLSTLVFGDAILSSQRFLIETIPSNNSILIIGGGTGNILEEITRLQYKGLQITYVENSRKMIELSQKKNIGNNEVVFIHQSIEKVQFAASFDVIITPFFLDNYSQKTLEAIFKKLHLVLNRGGFWLFADFQIERNSFWQKSLLTVMYTFFRVTCHIEASQLPDTSLLFAKYNYSLVARKTFFRYFIEAIVYKKR